MEHHSATAFQRVTQFSIWAPRALNQELVFFSLAAVIPANAAPLLMRLLCRNTAFINQFKNEGALGVDGDGQEGMAPSLLRCMIKKLCGDGMAAQLHGCMHDSWLHHSITV